MPSKSSQIKFIDHNRKFVNKDGILTADVVFVPLEDGDRCEALIKCGKKVITVDLNPLSRTAKTATITIVDNIIRAIKLLCERAEAMKGKSKKELEVVIRKYNKKESLKKAKEIIKRNLTAEK